MEAASRRFGSTPNTLTARNAENPKRSISVIFAFYAVTIPLRLRSWMTKAFSPDGFHHREHRAHTEVGPVFDWIVRYVTPNIRNPNQPQRIQTLRRTQRRRNAEGAAKVEAASRRFLTAPNILAARNAENPKRSISVIFAFYAVNIPVRLRSWMTKLFSPAGFHHKEHRDHRGRSSL